MALAFYMDVHVPAAITAGIRRRGIEVLTSQEDGTRRAADDQLLARATELGRILVSQDEDLLGITRDWQRGQRSFSGLVFAHQQGASIGRCVEDLEPLDCSVPPLRPVDACPRPLRNRAQVRR
jgi:hypothetical protein